MLMVIRSRNFKPCTYLQLHKSWLYLRTLQIVNMLKVQGVSLMCPSVYRTYELASANTKILWPFCLKTSWTGERRCLVTRNVGTMHEKYFLLNKGCLFPTLFKKHASWKKCRCRFKKKEIAEQYRVKNDWGRTIVEKFMSLIVGQNDVKFDMKSNFDINVL
jgi:hypothetical protein